MLPLSEIPLPRSNDMKTLVELSVSIGDNITENDPEIPEIVYDFVYNKNFKYLDNMDSRQFFLLVNSPVWCNNPKTFNNLKAQEIADYMAVQVGRMHSLASEWLGVMLQIVKSPKIAMDFMGLLNYEFLVHPLFYYAEKGFDLHEAKTDDFWGKITSDEMRIIIQSEIIPSEMKKRILTKRIKYIQETGGQIRMISDD